MTTDCPWCAGPATIDAALTEVRCDDCQVVVEVVRLELVLASAGWRDEQTGVVDPDRQVALGGRDEPARTEATSAVEQGLPGRLLVHPAMLRGAAPRRGVRPRRPAGRRAVGRR